MKLRKVEMYLLEDRCFLRQTVPEPNFKQWLTMSDKNLEKLIEQNYSRRSFLKNAGGSSLTVAGLLVTSGTLVAKPAGTSAADKNCAFGEFINQRIYLNSGTEGSMPECVLSSLNSNLKKWARNPTTCYELDSELGKRQSLNRKRVSKFFAVEENNICITDNTTMGLQMVLLGLNFKASDKVIITNHEHNAIRSPTEILQQRIGINLIVRKFPATDRLAEMNANELIDALFPISDNLQGAKALCVSHVYPSTGVRLPLALLSARVKKLGIKYLIVDGAQAMGMIDLTSTKENIEHCDFYAGPGHKWLNGPPSTGVLFIRNKNIRPPEFYPVLSQRMGKYSDCNEDRETCFPITEALQIRGNSNTPGFTAMVEAMAFIQRLGGVKTVEKHILSLSQTVKNHLLSLSPKSLVSPHEDEQLLSGLTVFYPFNWNQPEIVYRSKEVAKKVVESLLTMNIQIRYIGFEDIGSEHQNYALRVSTAMFNTKEDVNLFIKGLEVALKEIIIK